MLTLGKGNMTTFIFFIFPINYYKMNLCCHVFVATLFLIIFIYFSFGFFTVEHLLHVVLAEGAYCQ